MNEHARMLAAMLFSIMFGYMMGSIAAALGARGPIVAAVVTSASGVAGAWAADRIATCR